MAQEPGDRISVGRKAVRWALQKAAGYAGVSLSLTDPKGWSPLFGNRSSSGKSVTEDTAMTVSAVYACVRILAESVAQLPLAIFERQKDGNAEKVDHPLTEILTRTPNADMTPVEYIEAKQTNLGLQGNAYSFLDRRGNGDVASLYPIPSNRVIPQRNTTGQIEYKVLDRGQWSVYPREKIWQVKGFGNDGLMGYAPIGMLRNAIGLGMAAEEFGAKVFENGAYPSLVVKIPQWLKEDQRKIARENLRDLWAGLANAHTAQLLEGGMEIDPNGGLMPAKDLQLLELRRFQVEEICRLYGVPPHMVASLERATFSNIEQMSLEFVTYALIPWLRRWETSANRWLLKPADRERFFIRFNYEAMLRGDTAARAEFYSKMLQNGVYNRNEVRAKENMNSVKGLDDYTVQSNMTPVDKLAALVMAQVSKPEPTPPAPVKSGDIHLHNTITTPELKAEFRAGDTHVDVKPGETHVHHKGGDVTLSPEIKFDAKPGTTKTTTEYKRNERDELVESQSTTEHL